MSEMTLLEQMFKKSENVQMIVQIISNTCYYCPKIYIFYVLNHVGTSKFILIIFFFFFYYR